jgi:hypothetical protein
MITQTANYAPINPSIQKYTYTMPFVTSLATPINFTPSTWITSAMRAFYGYSSSSKITALELRIVNAEFECPVASAMNTQNIICLTHNTSNFTRMIAGIFNSVAPLTRVVGSVTSVGYLQSPVSTVYITLIPANYASSSFTLSINNASTGTAQSTSDIVAFTVEFIEYVSVY